MLSSLRIAPRLAIAIVLPVVLLVWLAAYDVAGKWSTRSQMAALGHMANAVKTISGLIHELQRERGTSATYIASKGEQMRSELPAQRTATDRERAKMVAVWADLRTAAVSGEFGRAITSAEAALAEIDTKRSQIDRQALAGPDSFAHYTTTIGALLTISGEIVSLGRRAEVTAAIMAYLNLMHGKELAGQERATGAAGLAAGKFDVPGYRRVVGLAAAQDAFFTASHAAATPQQRTFFRQTLSGKAVEDVLRMRDLVASGGLSGDLSSLGAKTWFDATTVRIDLMRTVEDRMAADLTTLAADVHAEATRELATLAGIGILGPVLGLFLVVLMARSMTRPLANLAGLMKELAGGNLEVAVQGCDRGDEIGEMARAVEVFKAYGLQKNHLEDEQKEREARASAQRKADMRQLADSFEAEVSAIVTTVSSSAGDLESAASTLSRAAENMQHLSAKVAGASEDASGNVHSVALAADELSASVAEIDRQVQESSSIAEQAVQQAQHTDARIAELSKAASRIGDVVKLITAIAEQTNLLALNATIEAARAGEAGRGFAVVAQEVKALAAQTAKATGDIGAQITDMQTATGESVAAIKEIGGTINRISEIAATIATAVDEQRTATQAIARNVQQAAQGASQVTATIGDLSNGAQATGSASSQVLSSAQALSMQGNRLRLQVEKFLTTVRAA
jgi:methyl-accepting chemotaxis protein